MHPKQAGDLLVARARELARLLLDKPPGVMKPGGESTPVFTLKRVDPYRPPSNAAGLTLSARAIFSMVSSGGERRPRSSMET
jgi:hypothetical protein